MDYTLIIIVVTAIVSILAFSNHTLYDKLILWPRRMHSGTEYYRLVTSGFIHADYQHLFFNMFTLFFFGQSVELLLGVLDKGILFPFIYVTGIIISSLPSFLKNRNNPNYMSLGASGGVASIMFMVIYYDPWGRINFIIPSILFAIAYLIYSAYASKKSSDNINHDAHLWGALYGLAIAWAIDPTHGLSFVNQLLHPRF
jgi:membrane associated rhomboid family serine protease